MSERVVHATPFGGRDSEVAGDKKRGTLGKFGCLEDRAEDDTLGWPLSEDWAALPVPSVASYDRDCPKHF